jgi:hypothetical protein
VAECRGGKFHCAICTVLEGCDTSEKSHNLKPNSRTPQLTKPNPKSSPQPIISASASDIGLYLRIFHPQTFQHPHENNLVKKGIRF